MNNAPTAPTQLLPAHSEGNRQLRASRAYNRIPLPTITMSTEEFFILGMHVSFYMQTGTRREGGKWPDPPSCSLHLQLSGSVMQECFVHI